MDRWQCYRDHWINWRRVLLKTFKRQRSFVILYDRIPYETLFACDHWAAVRGHVACSTSKRENATICRLAARVFLSVCHSSDTLLLLKQKRPSCTEQCAQFCIFSVFVSLSIWLAAVHSSESYPVENEISSRKSKQKVAKEAVFITAVLTTMISG